MKKLLLLTACFGLLLSSCMKSNKYEPNPMDMGIRIYNQLALQNQVAMDPFNVAYRLNLYMDAIAADPEQQITVHERLFKNVASEGITHQGDVWTIVYTPSAASITTDFSRVGTFIINTGGKGLNEVDARWTVTTPVDSRMLYAQSNLYATIQPGNYVITRPETNYWRINTISFRSGDTRAESTIYSNWTCEYEVKKVGGDDGFANLSEQQFEMTAHTGSGCTDFGQNAFTYEVESLSPICYAANVGFAYKTHGEERATLSFADGRRGDLVVKREGVNRFVAGNKILFTYNGESIYLN